MLKIFSSKTFQDSNSYRKEKIFNFIVIGAALIVTALELILCFTLPKNYLRWIFILLVYDIVSVYLLFLSRKGHLKTASFSFIAFIMTIIFGLSWTAGGIMSSSFRLIPALILGAGLFLGWRSGLLVGIISLAGGLVFVLAETFQVLPVSVVTQNTWGIFFNYAALIGILMVLQYITIENLDSALQNAQKVILLLTKTEEELRKSEVYRKTVFESSRVPIVVMDAATYKYVDCNQAAVEIYRFPSREKTLGKSPMDFSALAQYDGSPSLEKAQFYIEKALNEDSVVFEWKHQRPNGEYWDAEVHLMSFNIDNQQLLQFTLIDITERKHLEEALSESEEKFHTLFENASDSIFLMEGDKFIDCNASTLEMFGCNKMDQIKGHSPMEYSPGLQSNGRDSFEFGREKIAAALSGQKQFFEWTHKKLDGTLFPAEVSLNRVEIGGKALLQAIIRDITERKQTEEALKESEGKLRAMFESSRDSIGVSKGGLHVFANSAYLQLFGFENNEKVIGKPILESIAQSSRDKLIKIISCRTSGEPAPTFYEARGLKVDGTEFDAEFSVSTYELNGEIYSLATIRDITERKQIENTLYFLAQRNWKNNSINFFEAMAVYLGETLGIDYVFIDRVDDKGNTARTLANYWLGEIQQNFEYSLKDTPCENIYNNNLCTYPAHIQQNFPKDFILVDMKAESYSGIPLWDSARNPIGLIALINREPMQKVSMVESLLQIVADRVGSEIERTEAYLEVRRERDRAQNYLDTVEAVIVALDTEGRITLINRKGYCLLGYTENELIGKYWFKTCLPQPEGLDLVYPTFLKLVAGETNVMEYNENTVISRDGSVIPIAWHNTILHNSNGEIIGTLSAGEDITLRKNMENTLREKEEQMRAIVEGTPHLFFYIQDAEANTKYVSPTIEHITGYNIKTWQQRKDWFITDSEINRDAKNKTRAHLQGLNLANNSTVLEIRHANGNLILLECYEYPIMKDGKVVGLQGVCHDITKRKHAEEALMESERRLSTLMSNLPGMVYRCVNDQNWSMTFCSEGCTQLTGWDSKNLMQNNPAFGDLIVLEDQKRVWDEVQIALQENLPFELNYNIKSADGQIKSVWERGRGVLNEQGQFLFLEGFITDITERKRAGDALRQSEARLHAILSSMKDIVFEIDLNGCFESYHSAISKNLYVQPDYFVGKKFYEVLPEDVCAQLRQAVESINSGSPFQQFEYHLTIDNTIQWEQAVVTPRYNTSNEIIGTTSVCRNITERKLAEEALRESEAKYRLIVENAPMGIYKREIEGKFHYINPGMIQQFECKTEKELLDNYGLQSQRWVHPEKYEEFKKLLLENRRVYGYETESRLIDGTTKWFALYSFLDDSNQFVNGFSLDITNRKKAEEQLRKLSRAVEQSASTIVITDSKGNIEYVNPKFTETTGYTFEEAIGKNPRILKSGYTSPEEYKCLWDSISSGREWHGEFHNKKKNGDLYWEYATISQVLDKDRETTHFIAVKEDITERKRAEKEIRESQKLFKNTLSSLLDAVFIIDAHTVEIIDCNPAASSIFGYTREEMVGKTTMFMHINQSALDEFRQHLNSAVEENGFLFLPAYQMRRKDASIFPTEHSVIPIFNEKGERTGWVSVVRDITERKRVEEELNRYKDHLMEMVEERTSELEQSRETFRALAENTKDVITRVNDRFQFLYVNSTLQDVFGIPAGDYFGKTLSELNFPQNIVEGFINVISSVFETRQNKRIEFQLPNGVWADLMAMPEFDILGNVCSVIISARDITELKKLQLEIEAALEKEKELNQLKNRFMSMVSHEYRTPLTSILSSVEILEMKDDIYTKEKKKTHFNRIEKNIDYLVSMIDEVLYVNRIDSNRVNVSVKNIDLSKFCTEIFDEIKELYPETKSVIKIDLSEEHYKIDEAIVKKILINLVTNAYKYNKEKGEVSFIINSEKDKLIFNIADTGIGIPEDEQKNVFEPFSRMSNTQNIKGTGLGLNIVKKSVEQLGGNVSFKSKKDEGTTFTVILPIKQ